MAEVYRRCNLGGLILLAACGDALPALDASSQSDASPPADAAPPSAACSPVAGSDLVLEPVVDGLVEPVLVTSPPGDRRLFVVEKAGRIRIALDGQLLDQPFLDLGDQVVTTYGEQGLLGLAFHPDFARNRRFFVFFTAGGGLPYLDVVAEYSVSAADADRADPESERRILEVADPHKGHNGGMMAFGPDGALYIGFGDGGGGGDPGDDAQDLSNLLGDIARIDVDSGGELPYAIPADNPYAGGDGGARPEIWLSGMRNPWRWSFDRATGDLYIADVGEATVEEVSLVPAGQGGLNLGWNDIEGDLCFDDPDCLTRGHHPPIATYRQGDGTCAVIGGYVYRGACYPDLAGRYFYADHCSNHVFTLRVEEGVLVDGPDDVTADLDPGHQLNRISAFGQDATGEIYLVTRLSGRLFHIAAQP